MKVLVTGSNGLLGCEIRKISKICFNDYIFSARNILDKSTIFLDITNIELIRQVIKDYNIEVIVNCAAYTNVEKAETDIEACELLNIKGVENLSIVAKEFDCLLIHISTDYVFDGKLKCTPYIETDVCSPNNVYGKTKLEGEKIIQKIGCKHIILRTSWLYSEFGKNFCKTMINLLGEKDRLKVVFDQVGTPTYAFDLAKAIDKIIGDYTPDKKGIYHFSNEGICSWYDFTKVIANCIDNNKCIIQPCLSEEFNSIVKRPNYSVLDKTKIKDNFGIKIPYWIDSLKECIKNIIK